jgi:hypothetical protein
MKRISFLFALALIAAAAVSCSKKTETTTTSEMSTPPPAPAGKQMKPSAAAMSHATTPKAPKGATVTKKTAIGSGNVSMSTANSPTDTDDSWMEMVDIDGDGDQEQVEYLWDDEDMVLYAYTEDDSTIGDGSVAAAELWAFYGQGNAYNQAVGSGWYVEGVGTADSTSTYVNLWGCDFDANGNATQCGACTIDASNDAIVVTQAPAASPGM